ncbi:MAG TPA: hypothetical protein DCQ06_09845 [Myxococcales bacterium]|nr:hypothetical protein [Myxococcales bacterium]HAN31886.1 hypothetical protein [Myxococcales bacterium]
MERRNFLRGCALALAGATLPAEHAHASTTSWGDYPKSLSSEVLPSTLQAKNVLEFFMYGGVSPWETFYAVDDWGKSKGWFLHSFNDSQWSIPAAQKLCAPSSAALTQPFAKDLHGTTVGMGPFAMPLRARADLLARLRLHVVQHDLIPHQAALPLAITGQRIGTPKMAAVGSHVQRYFQSHATSPASEPHAFVLRSIHRADLAAAAAVSTGLHVGTARPVELGLSGNLAVTETLKRTKVKEGLAQRDALLKHYAKRFQARAYPMGSQTMSRAPMVTDYLHSLHSLQVFSKTLAAALPVKLFTDIPGTFCGKSFKSVDTSRNLRVAIELLRRPGSQAKHITVFDSGMERAPVDFGHDTHTDHVKYACVNYQSSLQALCNAINKPGENDSTKIDLNETLVVINTEFGRTPWAVGLTGRNHHPGAYVTAMLGGPIGSAQKGIVGAIDSSGVATKPLTPSETRAATLVALGIYPFAQEAYSIHDINGVKTEEAALQKLRKEVLGVV